MEFKSSYFSFLDFWLLDLVFKWIISFQISGLYSGSNLNALRFFDLVCFSIFLMSCSLFIRLTRMLLTMLASWVLIGSLLCQRGWNHRLCLWEHLFPHKQPYHCYGQQVDPPDHSNPTFPIKRISPLREWIQANHLTFLFEKPWYHVSFSLLYYLH